MNAAIPCLLAFDGLGTLDEMIHRLKSIPGITVYEPGFGGKETVIVFAASTQEQIRPPDFRVVQVGGLPTVYGPGLGEMGIAFQHHADALSCMIACQKAWAVKK